MSSRHRMPAGGPKGGQESAEKVEQASTEDPTVVDASAPEEVETSDAPTPTPSESEEATQEPMAETPDTADAEAAEAPGETSDEPDATAETSEEPAESTEESDGAKRKIQWSRVLAYGILPGLALLLALAAGFSRWEDVTSAYGVVPPVASEENPSPATESMNAAKDSTIKMLSYKPDTVDQQLNAARDLLTGDFRDSYTSLINDVVIPGAQQKQISAVASVPAVASVSADPKHAVVLVFVNQTVVVGQDPPSDTASSVRVTLDKIGDRWLRSEFEPVWCSNPTPSTSRLPRCSYVFCPGDLKTRRSRCACTDFPTPHTGGARLRLSWSTRAGGWSPHSCGAMRPRRYRRMAATTSVH